MARALISIELTPKTPADREKLARALPVLLAEGHDVDVRPGREPDSTAIGAATDGDLERAIDRLTRHFRVEAWVGSPAIAYLETVARSAEGSARYVDAAHGRGQYAHVALRIRPAGRGSGYSFQDATIGEPIPKRFMTSIDRGVRESMANGTLRGYPVVDVHVDVHDGSYHDTDSTESAFAAAAAQAFQEAARGAQPVLLEPSMEVTVRTAHKHAAAILEALRLRGGEIDEQIHLPETYVISARSVLAALMGFEWDIRSRTHGEASCAIRFAGYQPVVEGPAGDQDGAAPVGAPRRTPPSLRRDAASVPEPDDSATEV